MITSTTQAPPSLGSALAGLEWYDNHKIELILACKRKAFWHLVGPPRIDKPLAMPVGGGADFGTCSHAAVAAYRYTWQRMDEFDRRREAYHAFAQEWYRLFPNGPKMSYHQLERGLMIVQAYFERFEHEQSLYRPIDPEMGFAIQVSPRSNEPAFKPFWFAGRIDGIDERLTSGDWVVDELKTTSGGADRRLKSLSRSRQPKGYVWAAREIVRADGQDPARITGFLGDVILVAAKKIDFARDYFPVSINDTESWRRQTINIVQEWRTRLDSYRMVAPLDAMPEFVDWQSLFYETTEECFKYGQCPFFDLCQFGPSPSILSEYALDTWDPLGQHEPLKTAIIGET
jgi:hypothetical protein